MNMFRQIAMRLIPIVMTLPVNPLLAQVASNGFVVKGHVTDPKGAPAKNASVSIRGANAPKPLGIVLTDSDGAFHFTVNEPGPYRVIAWDESAGVPEPNFLLFEQTDSLSQNVRLIRAPDPQVTLRLPPPYGRLMGTVIDKVTGQPVLDSRIKLTRAESEIFLSRRVEGGKFSFLLPKRGIKVLITAPGYQDWALKDASGVDIAFILDSGAVRHIVVELKPFSNQTQSP